MCVVKNFEYEKSQKQKYPMAILAKGRLDEELHLLVKNKNSNNYLSVGYAGIFDLEEVRRKFSVVKEFYEGDKVELQF